MGGYSRPFQRQAATFNPGKYRSLLTLTASSEAQGEGGDAQPDWLGQSIEVHGRWRQTSQREAIIDGGKYSGASGVWEIPWVPDVTDEWRVQYGARYYRIVGIENIEERNRELHLYCSEDEGARGLNG